METKDSYDTSVNLKEYRQVCLVRLEGSYFVWLEGCNFVRLEGSNFVRLEGYI